MAKTRLSIVAGALATCVALSVPADDRSASSTASVRDFAVEIDAIKAIREGRRTFRYATFGDEAFWGDALGLHEAIAGAANGGVGPGVSPKAACVWWLPRRRFPGDVDVGHGRHRRRTPRHPGRQAAPMPRALAAITTMSTTVSSGSAVLSMTRS